MVEVVVTSDDLVSVRATLLLGELLYMVLLYSYFLLRKGVHYLGAVTHVLCTCSGNRTDTTICCMKSISLFAG